jgi:anti-sigma factor RsiW
MTMNRKATICEQLDGYVCRWLTADERVEFESHLADCPACRRLVQVNERLDSLLAQANAALLPVPGSLLDRIDRRLRQARRWRVITWTAGVAAAGILICVLTARFFKPPAPDNEPKPSPTLTERPRPVERLHDPRSLVQVTVANPSDVIAAPQRTDNPSVTIIWLYPTIKAAQEPSSAPSELFQPPERNGI